MINETFCKFDKEGKVLPYYGNTIISFMNQKTNEIYQIADRVQKRFMESGFRDCLSFLPPSSFHMTILPLCRVIDKGTQEWPKFIPETLPFKQVDLILKEKVEKIKFPEGIVMILDSCDETKLVAKPWNEQSEKLLKQYRDEISEITGIRHGEHGAYRFHISYSYKIKPFNEQQQKEKEELCADITEELQRIAHPFPVPAAQFVIFNDMLSYDLDISKRGSLY